MEFRQQVLALIRKRPELLWIPLIVLVLLVCGHFLRNWIEYRDSRARLSREDHYALRLVFSEDLLQDIQITRLWQRSESANVLYQLRLSQSAKSEIRGWSKVDDSRKNFEISLINTWASGRMDPVDAECELYFKEIEYVVDRSRRIVDAETAEEHTVRRVRVFLAVLEENDDSAECYLSLDNGMYWEIRRTLSHDKSEILPISWTVD